MKIITAGRFSPKQMGAKGGDQIQDIGMEDLRDQAKTGPGLEAGCDYPGIYRGLLDEVQYLEQETGNARQ